MRIVTVVLPLLAAAAAGLDETAAALVDPSLHSGLDAAASREPR